MQRNSLKLKIGYLYPELLQGFCDEANVGAFILRAKERGIKTTLVRINAGQNILTSKAIGNCDFYYIGGSNIKILVDAYDYIVQNRENLRKDALRGIPMLAVYSGFMLFGASFQLKNQPRKKGFGILSAEFEMTEERIFGTVLGTCDFIAKETIAGFENHTVKARLKPATSPFLIIQKGTGNNFKDNIEGARFNNVIGTFLTSPILAQNPKLCDYLIATALRVKYKTKIPLAPMCNDVEEYSRNYIIGTK